MIIWNEFDEVEPPMNTDVLVQWVQIKESCEDDSQDYVRIFITKFRRPYDLSQGNKRIYNEKYIEYLEKDNKGLTWTDPSYRIFRWTELNRYNQTTK